jgi:hypothetical protein
MMKVFISLFLLFATQFAFSQGDTLVRMYQDSVRGPYYETMVDRSKAIPDKVFEFGIPVLLIFLVINALVTIFRIRAEAKLKEKAIDKGISEPTLVELFREDKNIIKYGYLKWFLLTAAIGISLLYIHFLDQFVKMSSGYLSLGVISLFVSIALFIYYRIIRKKG